MFKRTAPLLIGLLALATVAAAQPGGGRKGNGGPTGARPPPAARSMKPLEIVGVVQAVDTASGRITIKYDAFEPLNWPAGSQPFPVAKTALLTGVSVGEKVRFSLESGQIAVIHPFDAP